MSKFHKQLSLLLAQAQDFSQNYKREIEETKGVENEMNTALISLENALSCLNDAEAEGEEEHANSSRANSRDYQREENATTGREG